MAVVKIDIAGEFTGKKAFDKAGKSTSILEKSIGSLGQKIALAFSTTAILNYSKAAVQAAAADQRATASLANNLKNVGLAYASADVEKFIKNMQTQTGIMDDQLRPAFSQLAQVTGSVAKSQDMLNLAFDISSGTGQDFTSVVQTLSQAYVGNTKGLKKLNTGLTSAELTSMSYMEIQKKLQQEFSGSGKVALDTYAGQMQILSAAASDAQETIGYGLLDALKSITGQTDVQTLAESIGLLATNVSLLIQYTGKGLAPVTGFFSFLGKMIQKLPGFDQTVQGMGRYLGVSTSQNPVQSGSYLGYKSGKAGAAEAAAAKRQKELVALQKKSTKATQDQLKLTKAAAIFDLKRIQIAAALKGQISAEEQIRLELMMAIEDKNAAKADELTKKLADAQANNSKLADSISALPNAKDPYAGFNVGAIGAILNIELLKAKVTELTGVALSSSAAMGSFAMGISQGLSVANALSGARYAGQAANQYGLTDLFPVSNVPASGATGGGFVPAGQGQTGNVITLNVTGALDPIAVSAQIAAALGISANTVGTYYGLGSGFKDVTYII